MLFLIRGHTIEEDRSLMFQIIFIEGIEIDCHLSINPPFKSNSTKQPKTTLPQIVLTAKLSVYVYISSVLWTLAMAPYLPCHDLQLGLVNLELHGIFSEKQNTRPHI